MFLFLAAIVIILTELERDDDIWTGFKDLSETCRKRLISKILRVNVYIFDKYIYIIST